MGWHRKRERNQERLVRKKARDEAGGQTRIDRTKEAQTRRTRENPWLGLLGKENCEKVSQAYEQFVKEIKIMLGSDVEVKRKAWSLREVVVRCKNVGEEASREIREALRISIKIDFDPLESKPLLRVDFSGNLPDNVRQKINDSLERINRTFSRLD